MAGCSKSDVKIHISTTSMIAVTQNLNLQSSMQQQVYFLGSRSSWRSLRCNLSLQRPTAPLELIPTVHSVVWGSYLSGGKVIGVNDEREQQAHKRKDTKQNDDRPTTPKCTHTHTHTHTQTDTHTHIIT